MTINSEVRKAGPFAGNGVTTTFPFAFKVFSASDMLVVRSDFNTGVETELVLGVDYSVSLNPDQDSMPGGDIITSSPLPIGTTLTATSSVPSVQPVDLTNQGGFYPDVINGALDRLTILVQQIAEAVSRSVKIKLSSESTPDQLLSAIDDSVSIAAASADAAAGSADAAASLAGAAAASAVDAEDSAIAAAQSAASLGMPPLTGAALDMLRVKADESGYEHRTPAQVRADIGAEPAGATAAMPIGGLLGWPLPTPPAKYLECDGSNVSRTTYAALFALLGTYYGAGDGSTTFTLPDFRGVFLRGWDHGRGIADVNRNVGVYTPDSLASHDHLVTNNATSWGGGAGGNQGYISNNSDNTILQSDANHNRRNRSTATGGAETYPKHVVIMLCIRALP